MAHAQDIGFTSRYNLNRKFNLFVVGNDEFIARVKKSVASLNFITLADPKNLLEPQESLHFVLAAIDFARDSQLQLAAKAFSRLSNSPSAYPLIYSISQRKLTDAQMLFSVEIGARYTFQGYGKDQELHDMLKRVVIDSQQQGTITNFSFEIDRLIKARKNHELSKIVERIHTTMKETEDSCRLLAQANEYLGRPLRVEHHLKKMLTLNPQNLWAANALGKLYLRSGRPAEGIEILQKLSHFQDLNGERFLELGHAYLNCGYSKEATSAFKTGDDLNEGKDNRFHEGMAQALILDGDEKSAQKLLDKDELSFDTLSFLNTRAVMAMRTARHDEGFRLYQIAIAGSKHPVITAKLYFNEGLGYLRASQPVKAITSFEKSLKLGGHEFSRADRTIKVAQQMIHDKHAKLATDTRFIGEIAWESIE